MGFFKFTRYLFLMIYSILCITTSFILTHMSIISVAEKINYNSMHNLMSLFCKTVKPNQT